MADLSLEPESALGGYTQNFGDTHLREVTGLDIVSIAVSSGARDALSTLLQEKIGLPWPATGTIERAGDEAALLGLQADQCFRVSASQQQNPVTELACLVGDAAYLTDQSDSWVVLELDGASSVSALERICPIDLSDNEFGALNVARTSMEHISVIIERPDTHRFRLYSPRSSAHSFLHAVTTSLHNL